MKFFKRRRGESIVITTPAGDRVTLTIVGVRGNQVRIGIEAGKHVSITRVAATPRPNLKGV